MQPSNALHLLASLPDRFEAEGQDLMRHMIGNVLVYRATINKWIRDELVEELGTPDRIRTFQKTPRGRALRGGDSQTA